MNKYHEKIKFTSLHCYCRIWTASRRHRDPKFVRESEESNTAVEEAAKEKGIARLRDRRNKK